MLSSELEKRAKNWKGKFSDLSEHDFFRNCATNEYKMWKFRNSSGKFEKENIELKNNELALKKDLATCERIIKDQYIEIEEYKSALKKIKQQLEFERKVYNEFKNFMKK